MRIERNLIVAVVAEETGIDELVAAITKIREDQATIFTDDNGGHPDGPTWIVPEADLDDEVVQKLLYEQQLVHDAVGDIVEYDGRGGTREVLDAVYPGGWCGFSSRGKAYCLHSARPTEFDWSETVAWLQENPNATPGGVGADGEPVADLLDIPLPNGFREANSIFLDDQKWGWDGDGDAETGGWELGESGWVVRPEDAEVWFLLA